MKKTIRISIIIFLLEIISCTKKADINLPTPENKLVISCFISPDDTLITATVRLSTPEYQSTPNNNGTINDDIKNASIKISDGITSSELKYVDSLGFYFTTQNKIPVVSGKTYSLFVSTPDGKNVSAATTVPSGKLQFDSFNPVKTKNDINNLDVRATIYFKAIPNQINYVAGGIKTITYSKINKQYGPGNYGQDDTTDIGGVSLSYFDDNEKVSKSSFSFNGSFSVGGIDTLLVAIESMAIANCSKEFYLYHRSITLSNDNAGNPFSEPVFVYSNINGGFGCFGAYISTRKNYRLR